MKYLFKNSHIIDPTTGKDTKVDILIVDGIIEKIGNNLSIDINSLTYDLSGKIVAPGFIDMHVHLREPGYEYKETIETGCMAAANGGFTAVCCMPNTNPPIDEASIVRLIKQRAENVLKGLVDIYPIAAITKGREGKELAPMMELVDAGAVGFSDDGSPVENAEVMRRALEYASALNKPIIQHPEELDLAKGGLINEGYVSTMLGMQAIPSIAEEIMIARDLQLTEYFAAQYHAAHISTAGSVELIRMGKKKKLNVSCEVTPHHFSLDDNAVRSFDTNTKMNPPLRTREDIEALKEGLRDGTIDVIATDHAPHSFDEKQVEFLFAPFGIVGLETAVSLASTELVHKNIISISQLIEKFSINPRRILNLPPILINEGVRANLTIFDPSIEWIVDIQKFKSKSKNSPFNGWKLKGKVFGIFNNGIFHPPE
ncbi:MAG: dihydroorotase [Bacteroidota bacterium]|nr:dihydroorotase [Bacteroidota bacterium]